MPTSDPDTRDPEEEKQFRQYVAESYRDLCRQVIRNASPEARLEGLSAEQRVKAVPVEERVKGLSTDELLNALAPKVRADLIRKIQASDGSLS